MTSLVVAAANYEHCCSSDNVFVWLWKHIKEICDAFHGKEVDIRCIQTVSSDAI